MTSAREIGLPCGTLPPGLRNSLADVPGVRVGHQTILQGDVMTGVTAILPHGGNLYREKVPAAAEVFNGFGKSIGLMQIEELGSLETPILLTNTLCVAPCATALIKRAIAQNRDIGRETGTVNPVVCECNDGWLSDLQALAVTEGDALAAIDAAQEGIFSQGAVGAGTGMRCFGFKGGIGTASRQVTLDDKTYHLGVLVLTNFGNAGELILPDGRRPVPTSFKREAEKGSVIVVLGTDVPLDHRQLRRVAKRCGAGLAKLGAFWGHSSGDIAVGFSTGRRILHDESHDVIGSATLNENRIDLLFRAAYESTEEAVINSMLASPTVTGRDGHVAQSLVDVLG